MSELVYQELLNVIKKKSEQWNLEGEEITIYFIWEKIIKSICQFVYERKTGKDFLTKENFIKDNGLDFVAESLFAEFLKRAKKDLKDEKNRIANESIDIKKFGDTFLQFKKYVMDNNYQGNCIKQLKTLFVSEKKMYAENEWIENSKNPEELEEIVFNKEIKRFLTHYLSQETINQNVIPFYLVLCAIYMYGKDCEDNDLKEYYENIISYRKLKFNRMSAKEPIEVVMWCINCCAELYFADENNGWRELVNLNGIISFLENFHFSEYVVKKLLLCVLKDQWENEQNMLPLDDVYSFMIVFRLESLNNEFLFDGNKMPFIGELGEKREYLGEEVQFASTDFRFSVRYLKDYFGKELWEKDYGSKFSYDVKKEYINEKYDEKNIMYNAEMSQLTEEGMEYIAHIHFNHFLANVLVLSKLPEDNFMTIPGFINLWSDIYFGIEKINTEINSKFTTDKERKEEKYNRIMDLMRYDIYNIRQLSKNTEEWCACVWEYAYRIWQEGSIKLSKSFLDKYMNKNIGFKQNRLVRDTDSIKWDCENQQIDEIVTGACLTNAYRYK